MANDRRRFVLLCEDDSLVVHVFQRAFADQPDYLLDVAMTVEDAIQKIRVAMYDKIFLDMRMDRGADSGMIVLRELAALKNRIAATKLPGPNTLVILMSGSIDFRDIMYEARNLGGVGFFDKPSDFTVEFVRDILNQFGVELTPNHK